MDYENEIQQLKSKIASYEKVLLDTAAPIIPSIVDNTILVPISGYTSQDRFNLIRTRVLEYVGVHRDTICAVFDFTGVDLNDVKEFDFTILTNEIDQLNNTLKLMGVRPIFVGFNPRIVREIVHAGIHMEIETYINFKTSLKTLLTENDKSLSSF
ncbi:STAS domain-containing protein [Sporosarcina sp. E16_3]|uniref:STAS domain-containing protein n=1 Tax=unclassified Sporosarcina TaxID=2647733 RepID=UPI0016440BC3|nr:MULTISPECIES: STAS domain-containing protein [unclassified Sporosarcina]MBO0602218.1 STAS domain-containing protein [Sporosarcina sp. E16_3]